MELEINNYTWLTMTSTQNWDPSSNKFEEQEERYENQPNKLICKSVGRQVLCSRNRVLSAFSRDSQICSTLRECRNTLDDDAFLEGLLDSRRIVSTAVSKTRHLTISPELLSKRWFMHIVHMDKKSQSHMTLTKLCQEVGVPNRLHTNGAKELNLGKWGEKVRELEIKQTLLKPYSQFQNRAESGIRELKKTCGRIGKLMGVPKPL
eukprot:scaffold82567_cov29-Attheya_sp.AAC.1